MHAPSPNELSSFLDRLCVVAATRTLPLFRSRLDIANKQQGGFDPVTEADRQAELAIRSLIEENYPNHGIVGEEFGQLRSDAPFQWIIDPIDGTRAFITGLPVWGTLIGLYEQGVPIAGVMDQPFTRERYVATGGGSVLSVSGGSPVALQTRETESLEDALLMTTSPNLFEGIEKRQYEQVEDAVRLARYGCDCYAYCLLASGHVDLVIESGLNVYDIAALIPIVEGAGGTITNWSGGDASQGGQILAAANVALRDRAIDRLNSV